MTIIADASPRWAVSRETTIHDEVTYTSRNFGSGTVVAKLGRLDDPDGRGKSYVLIATSMTSTQMVELSGPDELEALADALRVAALQIRNEDRS